MKTEPVTQEKEKMMRKDFLSLNRKSIYHE